MAIVIKTVSDSKQAQADLAKLQQSVDGIKVSADKVSSSLANFTKVIGVGLAAFGSFRAFTQYSDELTNLESKLRLVTKSQDELNSAFKEIQRIAVATRTDLTAIGSLYTRVATSATRFGATQRDIAEFSETVSKAIKISGAGVQEANAAIQQLGQALASGRLQGDELRSILENAPSLAMAIADGLGVSIGKMRALGEAGTLTNVKVFQAILKQQDKINASFDKMGVTYGGAFANLGNAFMILFSKVKEEALGSTSSLAVGINEFAKGIVNFANNFKLNMMLAKASVLIFVLDAVNLFDEFYVEVEKTGNAISQMAQDMYTEWKPVMVALISDLMIWSQTAVQAAAAVSASIYASFKSSEFGKKLIDGISYAFAVISDKITSIFENIKSRLPTIDVRKIFPGLDVALAYVRNWAVQVERWFYWVYDRVIGHSWIPDLVEGTAKWLKKLLGGPLSSIIDFATKANDGFKGIKIATVFTTAFAAVGKFRTMLLPLLGILTAIGAAIAAFGFIKSNNVTFDVKGLTGGKLDLNLSKVESLLGDAIKWLKSTYNETKKGLNNSTAVRTLKQIFGVQDTTPGEIFGVGIDTNAKVGRGPMRNQESRPVGHDIINALPSNWQIPFIATFTGIFAIAIMKAFDAGTTRSVLLSVLTSAAGIAMAQSVQDSTIKKSFGGYAFSMLDILEKGLSALFSGNVLKDPLGFLSLLAKTALLFEAGRKMLLGAAVGLAKAPTNMVQTMFMAGEAKMADRKAQNLTKELSNLPKTLNDAVKRNNDIYEQSIKRLARSVDQGGNVIGDVRARAAVRTNTTDAFGVANIDRVAEAARNLNQVAKSQAELGNVKSLRADMVKQRDDLKAKAEDLTKQVTEAKNAFTQGVKNFGAGVGGVLGGFAGFQIGVEIARGMTDSPGWSKVGVIIAATLGVQAIGSAIGLAMSSILLATAARMAGLFVSGLMLMNPFVRGAVIVGAAIYAGYQLFTNLPEQWRKALVNTFTASPGSVGAGYKNLSGTNDPLLFPGGRPQVSDEERAKNLEQLKQLTDAFESLTTKIKDFTGSLFGSSPVKKANGGWIHGPGSSTSDSIPAMLSNGEFVVNAKDARKNWDILTAINSGMGVSKFAGGTATTTATSTGPLPVVVQNAKEISVSGEKTISQLLSESFKDGYKIISEAVTKGIGNLDPSKTLGVNTGPSGGGGSQRATIQQQMENAKTMEASMGIMQRQLEKSGFSNISTSGLKSLSASTLNSVSEALDKINELQEKSAKRPAGSFLRKQAEEAIGDLNRQIASTLASAGAKIQPPGNLQEPAREYKPTEIFVKDQLDILNKAFGELELSLGDFYAIPDKIREGVFKKAYEIEQAGALIDREYIGLLEQGVPIPKEFYDKRQKIEKDRKEFQTQVIDELINYRTPFASLSGAFKTIGVNVSEDYFNALEDSERNSVIELLKSAKETLKILKKPANDVPEDIRRAAQEGFSSTVNKINEKIGEGAKVGLTAAGKLRFDLNKYSISLDDFTYNLMSDIERKTVEDYLSAMKKAKDALDTNPNMSESERKQQQQIINDRMEEISKITARNAPGYKNPGRLAGESFASSINEGFTSAITSAFQGKSEENKSVLRTLLDSMLTTISNTVIETFVKGLMNPLTGENGLLTTMFKNLGSSIFSLAGSQQSPVSTVASTATAGATAGADQGILSGIWSTITAGFASLMSFFGLQTSMDTVKITQEQAAMAYYGTLLINIATAIALQTTTLATALTGATGVLTAILARVSLDNPAFATGGMVSGPGTGTSDSIMANISNGEFIVNAKSTRKFLPLLEAINSNRIPKFADGGLSTGMLNVPASTAIVATPKTNDKPQQQVFQINITGDVSRQTRAEIQRMIPNIAYGVNSYNREKG